MKRSVYWNKYKTKIESKNLNNENHTRFPLDTSLKGVKKLFALVFNNKNNDDKKYWKRHYFLQIVKITDYNVLIDGRNVYDHPINEQIKKCDESRKIIKVQGNNYTAGCFLDYQYFKNHYKLITVDLSKQKALDADSRAIQQI